MGRSLLTALTLAAVTPAAAAEQPNALADSLGRVAVDMRAVADSGGSGPLTAINPAPLVLPDGSVLTLISSESGQTPALAVAQGESPPVTSARGMVYDAAGSPVGEFVLAGDSKGVHGAVWTTSGAFELRSTGEFDGGGAPLAEWTPVVGPENDCAALTPPSRPAFQLNGHVHNGNCDHGEDDQAATPELAADSEATLRVLVVFMDNATPFIGSEAAFAVSAIESANQAYANSGINPMRMELAGWIELPRGSIATGRDLLYFATGQGEGRLDEVHELADAYAADSVAIIGNFADACGVAWLSPDDIEYGTFSVTDYSCAVGNLSFAHEVGHNLGCAHDPDNAGGAYQPFAYGHRWNANQYRSVMAYAPGSRVPYFSNPDVSVFGGATGLPDARDNARNINDTDILLTNFRQGTGDPTDCDNSGTPDAIEIALDQVRDDNDNGVPDSCDIAAGEPDCNANGVIDEYETRPNFSYASGVRFLPEDGTPLLFTTPSDLPPAGAEPVALDIYGFGDLSGASEFFLVELETGEVFINAFATTLTDCDYTGEFVRLLIASETFNAMRAGGVDFTISPTDPVNPVLCGLRAYASIELNYRTTDASLDSDGNGVLDVCEQQACVADVTTTNVNPGEPGYGLPDGLIDGADLSYYVERWLTADPAADITTVNVNPGEPGYGQPDGFVDGADLSYFIEFWLSGCS